MAGGCSSSISATKLTYIPKYKLTCFYILSRICYWIVNWLLNVHLEFMHPNMQKWEKIRGIVFVNVQQACMDNILTELRTYQHDLSLKVWRSSIYVLIPNIRFILFSLWDQYQSRPKSYQYNNLWHEFIAQLKAVHILSNSTPSSSTTEGMLVSSSHSTIWRIFSCFRICFSFSTTPTCST